MSNDLEIKAQRRPGFFMIDNHVHDRYVKPAGAMAWGIYTTLWRHAYGGKTRTSVPQIAGLWGVHVATVKRALKKLRELRLITSKKTQSISIITLLVVEQLDFSDKLISGERISAPSEPKPVSAPVRPRKAHQRALGERTNAPYLKTYKTNKTVSTAEPSPAPGILEKKESILKTSPLRGAEVRTWLAIKEKLKSQMPTEEWDLLVRPAKLLKPIGGGFLVATPASKQIAELYWKYKKLLHSLHVTMTTYPDDHTIDRLKKEGYEGWDLSWIQQRREAKRKNA